MTNVIARGSFIVVDAQFCNYTSEAVARTECHQRNSLKSNLFAADSFLEIYRIDTINKQYYYHLNI